MIKKLTSVIAIIFKNMGRNHPTIYAKYEWISPPEPKKSDHRCPKSTILSSKSDRRGLKIPEAQNRLPEASTRFFFSAGLPLIYPVLLSIMEKSEKIMNNLKKIVVSLLLFFKNMGRNHLTIYSKYEWISPPEAKTSDQRCPKSTILSPKSACTVLKLSLRGLKSTPSGLITTPKVPNSTPRHLHLNPRGLKLNSQTENSPSNGQNFVDLTSRGPKMTLRALPEVKNSTIRFPQVKKSSQRCLPTLDSRGPKINLR